MIKSVYTSYYANVNSFPETFSFYCISRTMPAKVYTNIYHINEAKPSWYILKAYKNQTITFEKYKELYIAEKTEYLDIIYNQLKSNSVLLCWEKDYTYCHRSILAELLNKRYNLNIIEWSKEF